MDFDAWADEKIAAYIDRIRERLTEDNPISRNMRNASAGWYLEDDTFGRAITGAWRAPAWRSMLKAAQDAQMARRPYGTLARRQVAPSSLVVCAATKSRTAALTAHAAAGHSGISAVAQSCLGNAARSVRGDEPAGSSWGYGRPLSPASRMADLGG